MSKVHYDFPVQCVHGKVNKKDRVSFAKLNATGTCYAVRKEDWKMHYKTAQKQADAEARQLKFKSVAGNTRDRMTDPTKQAVDLANFQAQSKYKTLWGYLFHLEWEAYEGD